MDLLCGLTRREEPALRLNGVWALMNMAYQAEQCVKMQILSTLGTERIFKLLADPEVNIVMKTLGLLRNLLATKPVSVIMLLSYFNATLIECRLLLISISITS